MILIIFDCCYMLSIIVNIYYWTYGLIIFNFVFINYQNIRIMAEHDDFYEKLPYTLQENQTNPQYLIFGTGLQQTLIAAYKSKMQGKIGMIIDTDKTYGSSIKTVTFKEFNELAFKRSHQKMYQFITPQSYLESNHKFFEESFQSKKHRGYSIDIEPNFFLASSTTCECLKQADMDKYMDFHLVSSILHLQGNQLKPVPLSKGKIFQSKDLSLLQKKNLLSSLHKLIKLYQRIFKLEEDFNSTKQFDKDIVSIDEAFYKQFQARLQQYFVPFIEKLVKKNKKIMNFLSYIICNYQYNYEKQIPQHAKQIYTLKGFIQRFGKFIKSCGIYGQIPYLYVDNGIGDIPQAFSRIASIYGSTYILHPKVQIGSITKNSESGQYHIATNLSPEKPIVAKEVYFGPTHLQLRKVEEQFYQQKMLRIFVLSQKSGKQEKCPAICFINQFVGFQNPIYLFIFDSSTHSCPNDLVIHQFETILERNATDFNEKSQKLLEILSTIYGPTFRESIKYYSPYIRTRRYPKSRQNKNDSFGVGLNDTMGIDLDQHFADFIKIVGSQQNYFKKQNPNQPQDEQFGGYDTKYILQKMDELNIKGQPQNNLQQQQKQKKVQQNTQQIIASSPTIENKIQPAQNPTIQSQQKPSIEK